MPLEEIFENKLTQLSILVAFSFILLFFLSSIKNVRSKKVSINILSLLIIAYFDYVSVIVLLSTSTFVFVLIRKKVNFKKHIYPLSIFLVLLLLVVKDHYILFPIQKIYIPIGFSYYIFRMISFIIDSTKDGSQYTSISALDFYTWMLFFPLFFAGPIQRFNSFENILVNPKEREKGYRLLMVSIIGKFVLVDSVLYPIGYIWLRSKIGTGEIYSPILLILFGSTTFLHAYFDLMLYSTISNSISRILGFSYVVNFTRPLLASNISQFWNSYHVSLSSWTRDYIFFPTLIKTKKSYVATYASMITLGVWHSATWNWLIWAISHATAINFYGYLKSSSLFKKLKERKIWDQILKYSGQVFTLLFVSLVFIFVAEPDFDKAILILLTFIE